ncbi:MAG: sugar phosphate isomerase/epimerase [Chitinophagaceae bacterium]
MSNKLSRRNWSKLSLTGLAGIMLPPGILSVTGSFAGSGVLPHTAGAAGVIIGVQSYSFRDRSLDEMIKAMNQLGLKSCELWQGHVEPAELMWKPNTSPEEMKRKNEGLKAWRSTVTMDEIKKIRDKINNAGITIQAYNGPFATRDSDEEFELVFRTAQALGTDSITTSATVDVMKRVDVLARKYKIKVGMHNHANIKDPNEFATPESFMRGMEGNSEFIRINLDIGHFTAADYDAVDFMKKYHEKIICIHLKDRKKSQGAGVPFGEGDAPIAQVLKLIKENKWPIPANIEYEYKGTDTIAEVKKCLEYANNVLA